MGETAHHHHGPPPPQQAAPPPQPPPPNFALSRGPTWPPAEQLQHLHYCIHSNPFWPEAVLLAFEHYIVMLGTTLLIASTLVPRMGGDSGDKARVIQSLLFMSGINTLLQTFLGTRLPTVMGASFAFYLPVLSIINDNTDKNFSNEHDRFVYNMRTIQGSLIVSSFVNIILGFSKAWGNFTRLFSPVTIVPVVCVVGLGLFLRGFPLLANCVELGLPMLILLVLSQQSTGTFYAASRLAGATPPPAHVLSRSIGLHGIGMLLEGIFGSVVGTTASVENVGLLGLTGIGSRRVIQISTAFMIFFSIFGKFGAFFASIPLPIFGAIYCIVLGIVAAVGISFTQFVNNNSTRNHYVLGVSLFLGISVSEYFVLNTNGNGDGPVRTGGGWFNNIFNTIFSSAPTMAMIVGTILDNTLDARHTRNERGIPWWVPFQHRKGDIRNEEFYSYPLRIHQLIPTRFL
ncbi:nucleobase-ascorbate transporter 3 isoform X2 [Punica granatum]|uniref:Nucleobase-ascorbate transporter 3 isoform X2 n=1 Tax=Punica granatum TaxID=22663 RepID=A0A6P8EG24_PUNGR|nr:nucleobase-ascorbate transporter 3 isoform X2 [Punica granatum]